MVCKGLYFDDLEGMINIRKAQISASAKGNAEMQATKKKKSKAVYFERRACGGKHERTG